MIKKTNFVLNFSITKTFAGTFVVPIRRVPEGPGDHLVVVCMGLHGLHEFAVFSRGLLKQLFSNLLYKLLHNTNCFKKSFSFSRSQKRLKMQFFGP